MEDAQRPADADPLVEGNHKIVLDMEEETFRLLMVTQLRLGRDTMTALQKGLEENTELTRTNIASTAELVEIFKGAKTGASVFAWLGRNLRKAVKFAYPFLVFGGAVWAIKNGHWPKGD